MSIPVSEILSLTKGLGSLTDISTVLETAGKMNSGVQSLIKNSSDPSDFVDKLLDHKTEDIGENDRFNSWSKLFNPKNESYLTDKALPGIIGGIGAVEMLGHSDETFGGGAYSDLYKELNDGGKSVGRNKFTGDQVKPSEGPYGRAVWSKRIKTSQTQAEKLNSLIPKTTLASVTSYLSSDSFKNLPPDQKKSRLDGLLNDLQRDLGPLQKELNSMGIKTDGLK